MSRATPPEPFGDVFFFAFLLILGIAAFSIWGC